MNRAKLNKIMDLVDEVLAPAGFECIEAEWLSPEGLLRLYVDRPTGVDMQACVEATRLLRDWDGIEGMPVGSYTLEVSSPGIERPLRRRHHFEKFLHSEIAVSLTAAAGARRRGVGHLRSVSADGEITIAAPDGLWSFPLESVRKAHLVHKWDGTG